MLEQPNCAGPCTTACKPVARPGNQSIAFNSIMISATEHARREAGLPGRVDRERSCASCTDALPRRSIDWQGHLGVPTTRYGCAGMPCESTERENWRGRC